MCFWYIHDKCNGNAFLFNWTDANIPQQTLLFFQGQSNLVGRLICPEGRVSSLNKSNPANQSNLVILFVMNLRCPISCISQFLSVEFLYARLKNGRIMPWQCASVCLSVHLSFPDFFSTCFEISIWNLVYAISRWHDMSSLSFITIGSLWPSLQPIVGQTQF